MGTRGKGTPGRGRTRRSGGSPDTYGELGIRHEDTVAVTPDGCENLAPMWSGAPEKPAVA